MLLLLDECSGALALQRLLVSAGHDVQRSVEALSTAASDLAVLQYAYKENRVILTRNCNDFITLAKEERPHAGILLHYRDASGGLTNEQIVKAINNVAKLYSTTRGECFTLNHHIW